MRLGEYFLPQFPTGDMTTEDFLVMKSKEGLEERLEFLSRMKRSVKRSVLNMTSAWILNSR